MTTSRNEPICLIWKCYYNYYPSEAFLFLWIFILLSQITEFIKWLEYTVVNISRVQKFWGDSHLILNIPRLGAWYGILKYLIKFHEGGDCWGGTVSACHTAQYNIKVSKHYCTTPSWLDNFVRCIVLLYFRGTRQLTNNQIYNPIAFRTMNCSSATLYLKEIGNKWAYIMHKTFVIQSFSYVNKRIYLPDRTSWNTRWFRINWLVQTKQ